MTRLAPSAAWRARLYAAADQPPLRPRVPLLFAGEILGSVEADLFVRAGLAGRAVRELGGAWQVEGDLTASMERIAHGLRDAGLAGAWRDEQLAVRDAAGRLLGTVERAAARPLGLSTEAVHLVGTEAGGRHWIQQRAFDKPSDPGLWDTLVGGMVPACDTLEHALEREAWEEAGLRPEQLRSLRYGGRLFLQRPPPEVPHGYVVQHLHWYTCTLAADVAPCNQDGEVAAFAAMEAEEVVRRLEADEFTIDAGLILLAAFA